MKVVDKTGLSKTMVAALVGAVVALIISPLSHTLTFSVNEYLSRPILRVEYVEFLLENNPVKSPRKELQNLIQPECYSSLLTLASTPVSVLMAFQSKDMIETEEEFDQLQEAIGSIGAAIGKRLDFLKELTARLEEEGLDDKGIRSIAIDYFGQMAQYTAYVDDTNNLRESLAPVIKREASMLLGVSGGVTQLRNTVDTLYASSKRSMRLKARLSVLNKGSTDGLVRNIGELSFGNSSKTVQLKRTSPPKQSQTSMFGMAVPVAVTNIDSSLTRKTAVGKIQRNSMEEFWFEVDESSSTHQELQALIDAVISSKSISYTIRLFDQDKKVIDYSGTWQ